MLVALGAAGGHPPSVGTDLHAGHHETTAVVADTADHAFVAENAVRDGGSAVHCGTPMLGLAAMAGPAVAICKLPVRPPRFATLLGKSRPPEPEPPRPTA